MISRERQAAAVEYLIRLANGSAPKPKPSVLQMTIEDAKAGVETIKRAGAAK